VLCFFLLFRTFQEGRLLRGAVVVLRRVPSTNDHASGSLRVRRQDLDIPTKHRTQGYWARDRGFSTVDRFQLERLLSPWTTQCTRSGFSYRSTYPSPRGSPGLTRHSPFVCHLDCIEIIQNGSYAQPWQGYLELCSPLQAHSSIVVEDLA
jgi:hypothetical protein